MTQKEQDEALVTYPFYSDEVFMAWYYATYINYVAEAGKAEYPIPMYVNAWLNKENIHGPVLIQAVALFLMYLIYGMQVLRQ